MQYSEVLKTEKTEYQYYAVTQGFGTIKPRLLIEKLQSEEQKANLEQYECSKQTYEGIWYEFTRKVYS